jgi:hypothetical protein
MVTAYLTANDAYWKRIDGEPTKIGKWRNGTPSEATRVSLMAALASAPSIPPHAVVEAVPLEVDYDALIAAAFKLHRYRQGTGACIAFKHGAEWMREQMERGIAPKAAPAPEPSAPIDAFKLYAELRDLVAEAGAVDTMIGRPEVLRSRLSDLCKRVGQLTTDLPLGTAPAPEPSAQAVAHPSHQTVREWMPVSEALRLSDLWTAGDLDNCGQWRAAIKVLADEVRALAASPQPEPSAQGEQVAWISPKDRVPKGGEVVLCLFRDKGIHTALFRGTSTTHGVFEAWHGFLVADLPTDRVIGWVPLASAPSTPPPAVVEAVPSLHPATADLVRRFSQALAEKLAAAEAKYGYSDGWASPDWMDECRAKLMEHIAKGDPRDVAAYCAFLWHHGASTAHAREPLNFDRLQSVMAAHFGGRELTDDEADSAEAFARAIERAHGIGA